MSKPRILHILRGNALMVDRSLSGRLSRYEGVRPSFMLYDIEDVGASENLSFNEEWIDKLPRGMFKGVLRRSHPLANKSGYFCALCRLFCIEFRMVDFLKILFGPRNLVFHSVYLKPASIILLKFFFKNVTIIHWGGARTEPCTRQERINEYCLSFVDRILVLMSPELKYFSYLKRVRDRVQVLSYYDERFFNRMIDDDELSDSDSRCLLVGNSGWSLTEYESFLSNFNWDGWEKVVCMLSYGPTEHRDRFVSKWSLLQPEKFVPWLENLPYVEYKRRMSEVQYYVCPKATQTGLGAIYHSVLQKKTLFLTGDNYEWLNDLGMRTIRIEDVNDFSYENVRRLRNTEAESLRNVKLLKDMFLSRYTAEVWYRTILGK